MLLALFLLQLYGLACCIIVLAVGVVLLAVGVVLLAVDVRCFSVGAMEVFIDVLLGLPAKLLGVLGPLVRGRYCSMHCAVGAVSFPSV